MSDDTWNWKKDGYKWKNQGTKVFEEECISRTHFYIIPSSDSKLLLKRVAFTTLKPCGFLLVQYLRKECYSNTKKSTDLSTNPNTLAAMKSCHVVVSILVWAHHVIVKKIVLTHKDSSNEKNQVVCCKCPTVSFNLLVY